MPTRRSDRARPGEPSKIFSLRPPSSGIGDDHEIDSHRVGGSSPFAANSEDRLAQSGKTQLTERAASTDITGVVPFR
ncbi:MAG: hypothetical protein ABFS45_20095 [Pseudomonadota bacterium]